MSFNGPVLIANRVVIKLFKSSYQKRIKSVDLVVEWTAVATTLWT